MNYTEFKIGGGTRGFRFGLAFLGDILTHFDTDIIGFGEILTKNPYKCVPAVLYYSHLRDCEKKEKPIDFKESDIYDWLDETENGINNENVVGALRMVLDTVKKHLPKSDNKETSKKK